MDPRITRRSVLIGTAGILGAAACGKASGVIHAGTSNTPQLNLLVTSGAGDGPSSQSVSVFEAGMDQRVAFLLSGKGGFLAPASGTLRLQVAGDDKRYGPDLPLALHADTGAVANAYLTTTYRFARPGTYWLRASYQGLTTESPVMVIDARSAQVPFAGAPLIATPTPTTGDSRGVTPICTRSPFCPFHDVSLDQAMTKDKPVALMFATPALCESATCGPVLDTLVRAASTFADKITFVHSEIFTALSRNAPNTAAVLAYHLQSEPVLFLADAKATVVQRIDGLFGQAELTAALSRLVR